MPDEKFNWKKLFIKTDESESPAKPEPSQKEPSAPSASPILITGDTMIAEDIKNSIIQVYERGFESLNRDGFDFFEYFKSIMSIDNANSAAYQMAFSMAKSVNSNLSKEKLVDSAEFYIDEINKVHYDFDLKGQNKKNAIEQTKSNEKSTLTNKISTLQEQLARLQDEIDATKNELNQIDSKYIGDLKEINDKLIANNLAKDNLLNRITMVKNGLISHVN